MPKSQSLTEDEFDKLPRNATLIFRFGNNEQSWSAQFTIHGENVQIAAEFDSDVRSQLGNESTLPFRVTRDGKKLVYPPSVLLEEEVEKTSNAREGGNGYYIDGLKPRMVEVDKSKIERLDADAAANLISNAEGRCLLFYTGAGMSTGGERPVWGMVQLKQELGLDRDGDNFAQCFKTPDEHGLKELLAKVDEFRMQLFDDMSTPAHTAMSEIVDNKEEAIVFTENIDLKHEAEGSRLRAVHMDSDEESFSKIKLRTPDAEVLVTAGLSKDDRAIIQYLKREKPELKIIAFTLSNDTIPDYLDEGDAVVLGGVQETLPKVAQNLGEKS